MPEFESDFLPEPGPLAAGEPRHLHWGAEALWRQLEPLLPGLSVEVLARVDSTNTRLLERARAAAGQRDARVSRPGELDTQAGAERTPHGRRAGDIQPCLLVAEHQTRGRGRQGRDWLATPGASLTFSLSLALAPAAWSGLSLAVGVALADALDPVDGAAAPRIALKWPNDLWLLDAPGRGRKLGGVLIETVSVGQHRMCVVGVGLNVLPQANEGLTHGYACLHELDPGATAPAALARVAAPLVRVLRDFERGGFAPLAGAYARRDLLLGQAVTTTVPEVPEGVAEGVDDQGALRVRCGQVHRLISGEVSVRLRDA
ncbi:MAG: biotin--[acetyl-CoA-carboxylase] ligase [Rubrivivax sp.]|nr:biotin--[acetyl-CoA-carboxylase] ligase [Rubrivivax sp.]